jgi:hypothetical protein
VRICNYCPFSPKHPHTTPCAGSYACLFYAASTARAAVPAALVALLGTVIGLSAVNSSQALASVLKPGQGTLVYWAETAAIAVCVPASPTPEPPTHTTTMTTLRCAQGCGTSAVHA